MAIRYLSGVNIDSNTLFVDDVNNRVGIRTGSPLYALHVNLNATGYIARIQGSTNNISFYDGGSGGIGIGTDVNQDLKLYTNDALNNGIVIKPSGNVGIGTSSPSQKLEVAGSINLNAISYAYKINGLNVVSASAAYTSLHHPEGGVAIYLGDSADRTNYYDNSAHRFRNAGGVSDYMVINSSGNVGIGTTSPADPLHILTSGNDKFIRIENSNAYTGLWLNDSGTNNGWLVLAGYTNTTSPGDFAIREYGVQTSLTIKQSSGNVGIGTTSPSHKLEVNAGSNAGMWLQGTSDARYHVFSSSSNDWVGYELRSSNVNSFAGGMFRNNASNNRVSLYNKNTEAISLMDTGNVGIGTTSPTAKLQVVLPANTSSSIFQSTASESLLRIQTFPTTNRMQLLVGDYNGTNTPNIGAISDSDTGIQWSGSNVLRFVNGGSENVTINASGNVGIGTTSPGNKLQVYNASGGIGDTAVVRITSNVDSTSNGATLTLNNDNTGIYPFSLIRLTVSPGASPKTADIYTWKASSRDLTFRSNQNNGFEFVDNGNSNLVTITGAGNVGIGTTAPGGKLDVVPTSQNGINVARAGGYPSLYGSNDLVFETDSVFYFGVYTPRLFSVNGSFYVTTSGDVGIGTSSPLGKLDIRTTSGDTIFRSVVANGGTATSNDLSIKQDFITGVAANYLWSNANYTLGVGRNGGTMPTTEAEATALSSFVINSSGNVGIGTTTPAAKLVIVTGSADSSGNSFSFTGYGSKEYVSISKLGFIRTRSSDLNGANMHFLDNGGANRMEMAVNASSMTWYSHALASTFMVFQHTTGNVGIGTTSPTAKLDVYGGALTVRGTQSTISINPNYPGSGDIPAGTLIAVDNVTNNNLGIIPSSSGTVGSRVAGIAYSGSAWRSMWEFANTSGSEPNLLLVKTAGNVGIGTASPGFTNGSGLEIEKSGTATLRLQSAGSHASEIYQSTTELTVSDLSSGVIAFRTNDTERMRISSGNVGIGTTSPGYKFTVNEPITEPIAYFGLGPSNASSRNSLIVLQSGTIPQSGSDTTGEVGFLFKHSYGTGGVNGTANGGYIESIRESVFGITSQVNTALVFGTSSANTDGERLRITSTGNVGIGTTSPGSKLHIGTYASAGNYVDSSTLPTTPANHLITLTPPSTTGYYGGGIGWSEGTNVAASINAYDAGAGGALGLVFSTGNNTTISERLRIDTDGNVGIGTTGPAYKLDVEGNARVTSDFVVQGNTVTLLNENSGNKNIYIRKRFDASSTISWIRGGGNTDAYIGVNDTEELLVAYNNTNLGRSIRFINNGSEAVRFDSSGNVGIGTTSPAALLHIKGTGDAIRVESTNTGAGGAQVDLVHFTTSPANEDTHGVINFGGYYSGTTQAYGSRIASIWTDVANRQGRLDFTTRNGSNFNTAMTIAHSSNVGIGTTSPNAPLHIVKDLGTSVSAVLRLRGSNSTARTTRLQFEDYNGTIADGLIDFIIPTAGSSTGARLDIGVDSAIVSVVKGGNVGIGTNSPVGKLDVALLNTRRFIVTYDDSLVTIKGANNTGAGENLRIIGDNLIFNTSSTGSGSERMRITSAGNVGIGTTAPTVPLHIVKDNATINMTNTTAFAVDTGSRLFLGGKYSSATSNNTTPFAWIVGAKENATDGNQAGYLSITTVENGGGFAERMRVTSTGNVGIGTTSPATNLHVYSTEQKDTIGHIQYENANTGTGAATNAQLIGKSKYGTLQYMVWESNGARIGMRSTANSGSGNLYFTVGTDSVSTTMLANGNVGIGTTSPLQKLHISAGSSVIENTYAYWMNGSDYNWGIGRNIVADTGFLTGNTLQAKIFNGTTQGFQVVNSSNSALFEVEGNTGRARVIGGFAVGSITPSTTAGRIDASNDIVAFSTSDRRFKENITPIANALDKVKTLTGVEFDWKQETKDYHGYVGHDVGVIAQDVQAVLPEAVRTNHNGYLSVRYEKMIALLVEANKELAARVEELEKKLGQ